MKEYTIDNINKFFEDSMNKPNAKCNIMRVYGAYERECENSKRKQEIKEKYHRTGCSYIVYLVNDNIAIVEENEKGYLAGYYAHVNNRKSYCLWPTFEQSLLGAVSIKLTGREDAAEWMWKLVGGN